MFPKKLYFLHLQRKEEIQFRKPATIYFKVFTNEWIPTFLILINKVIVDLQPLCICKKMTVGPD
jgi:hypothetical protein